MTARWTAMGTAMALAAAMLASPALGQTSTTGESAGARPSGAGEQSAANPARPDAQDQQAAAQLAKDAMAAQQMGYLAADKNLQAGYALLGDQMALTNSQVNQRLDQYAQQNNLSLPRQMDAPARARFEQMRDLNQDRFAQDLVAFVNDTYPRILQSIDALSARSPDSPAVKSLANEIAPALRDQMRTAQQLAQGEGLDQQKAERMNRGPIERKDDPGVMRNTAPER